MTRTELTTTSMSTDRQNGEDLSRQINRSAREAYLASAEYRTFAYAYALLPMGMFDERQASLGLNFSHRKNTANVDLTVTPTSDGALLPTVALEVDLHLTGGRTFAALNGQSDQPRAPMTTSIPVAAFCDLAKDATVKISLATTSRQSVPESALYTDARRFPAMDRLLAE